jgi:hypothetical protein
VNEPLTAALTRLSEHAARLRALEESAEGTRMAVGDLSRTVEALGRRIAALAAAEDQEEAYQPIPAVQWWTITGAELEEALKRLRSWVNRIYLPMYGHLARQLAACWDQHPLCLIQLDWLSEMWSALYLQPGRDTKTLAAQAEFGTRIVPAVAAQLATETSRCSHRTPQARHGRGLR